MGITNFNKQVNKTEIDCDGELKVTLALNAAPDIVTNPTDIMLVLDRSGSMEGDPLFNMKLGANKFIDIIYEATNSDQNGNIGSGSRIGVVSFSGSAVVNSPLATSVADLKEAVNSLTAGGTTNHADAFTKAMDSFDPSSQNAKVIVMFTDGETTSGPPPTPVADQAKAQGIIIYCIGLVGSDGVDVDALNRWASDPAASHVSVTPDASELEELFEELAANISKPGATNIVIEEKVNSDFVITALTPPLIGTAEEIDDTAIKWKIPQLGVTANEGAVLEFYIKHRGCSGGKKLVNESISYEDTEGNKVVFPEPAVEVNCDVVVEPEGCPVPLDFDIPGCTDYMVVEDDVYLSSQGRIVSCDITVKKVCPNKRVALAVLLTETDKGGEERQRGMKTVAIPAHDFPCCRDVLVKHIKFVLPESLAPGWTEESGMCTIRNFRVRCLANYIDFDCHEWEDGVNP